MFFQNIILSIFQTPQSGLKDQISEKLWNRLSEGQQQFLLKSEEKKQRSNLDDSQATPIVKEITKMQVPKTDSAGQFLLCCNLDEIPGVREGYNVLSRPKFGYRGATESMKSDPV